MAISEGDVAVLAVKFAVVRQVADERTWRVYLGSEARALGHGGIAAVARAAGVSQTMVAAGAAGIEEGGLDGLPRGRSRRPGGGRRRLEDRDPGLRPALRELAGAATRGDPVAEITWCSLSLRDLEGQLALRGFRCGKDAVARIMREDGYSLRGMSRVLEGKQHPDRDAQSGRINTHDRGVPGGRGAGGQRGREEEGAARPVSPGGPVVAAQGDPVKVRDHDFPNAVLGKITPSGVYDIAANRGFVFVGTSHDTAAFAVSAPRLWWQREGALRYPGARRLLVTCDAGGSNSCRSRLRKDQLAVLAARTGLEINPAPGPEPAGRCAQDVLNHPALTGISTSDLQALAAALRVPYGARREQRNYTLRGGRRVSAVRDGGGSNGHRRTDLTDHVIAWRLREHLHLPVAAIGALLGIHASTASHAATLTAALLAASSIPKPAAAPPPATPPRTPAELLDYAAANGIALTIPDNSQTMPEHFRKRGEKLRHART